MKSEILKVHEVGLRCGVFRVIQTSLDELISRRQLSISDGLFWSQGQNAHSDDLEYLKYMALH